MCAATFRTFRFSLCRLIPGESGQRGQEIQGVLLNSQTVSPITSHENRWIKGLAGKSLCGRVSACDRLRQRQKPTHSHERPDICWSRQGRETSGAEFPAKHKSPGHCHTVRVAVSTFLLLTIFNEYDTSEILKITQMLLSQRA